MLTWQNGLFSLRLTDVKHFKKSLMVEIFLHFQLTNRVKNSKNKKP
jgi:hypothetical protein